MEIWDNTHMLVFMVRDEGSPEYLPCTGISNIEWSMTEENVCQYCGSVMKDNQCPNCGGTALPVGIHNLGQAVITLEGTLPQAISIFHLPKGGQLLLCHKCHGIRSGFDAREVVMRFLHCSQVAKKMPRVAMLYPEDEECLHVIVDVECDVELYLDGMDDTWHSPS